MTRAVVVPRVLFLVSMAGKTPSPSEALEKLEQQLRCPVCLERYTQPRTLPCLHSFCHECLGRFPVEVERGIRCISCPVCRQTSQLPGEGVSGYLPAFFINNFLDLHQLLQKVSGSQQINSCENCHKEQPAGYCKQCSKLLCQTCIDTHSKWGDFSSHQILGVEDVAVTASKLVPLKEQPIMECTSHDKPLEVYCDTCDKLICQLCTTAKMHRNHDYEPINDAFPRHQQQIKDSLQQVKKKLQAINAAVQALETQKGSFLEQVQATREEIKATVQQLFQLLQESERQLMKELDQIADTYVENVSGRMKEADMSIAQLKSCEEFGEEELRIGSQQEILVMKRQMVEHMVAVCSQVKEDIFKPLEKTRARFVKKGSVAEACHSLGSVVKVSQLEIARNKTSFNLSSTAPLSSELISCQLSPIGHSTQAVRCVLQQATPGSYVVCYPGPSGSDFHHLKLQVGGVDVLGTPLTVEAVPRKANQRFKGLTRPTGLAITQDGHLIVAEYDAHCISVFGCISGKKMRSFGTCGSGQVQFNHPAGIVLTQDGHVVVADSHNHRLQVLTVGGAFVSAVGSEGSQPLQFKYPSDIAVHHSGRLYVTDTCNYRVQVLQPDLTYSHCFGTKGDGPGEFNNPNRVAIDADGMVYVADYNNNRVQKFNSKGDVLTVIQSKGEDGQLRHPLGVCVGSDTILYVCERNYNKVCVYSSEGEFLGYICDPDDTRSKGSYVIYSQCGSLYVSDGSEVVTSYQ